MKKFKYKISADDTLDSISKAVSNEALVMARDDMVKKIAENPIETTVDYTSGQKEYDLNIVPRTPSGKDPYEMYSHVKSDGSIGMKRYTPERDHYITEIYKDGSTEQSTRKDFEKKVRDQSVSEEEISELGRIVRVSSDNPEDYSSAEDRNAEAYKAFDENKYVIEEIAARRNLPPALLSSVYYNTVAENGSITADSPSVRYAKLAYNRLYGQPLSWDDETLSEYLKTPSGALDFIAICLASEAKYLGYSTGILTKEQLSQVLKGYAGWNEKGFGYENSVMAFNNVFEDIYNKLPSKDYEIKLV